MSKKKSVIGNYFNQFNNFPYRVGKRNSPVNNPLQ